MPLASKNIYHLYTAGQTTCYWALDMLNFTFFKVSITIVYEVHRGTVHIVSSDLIMQGS